MARATEATLNALHETLASTLTDQVKKYSDGEFKDKDGEPLPVPSALLSTIRSYLNDNDINRPEDEEPDPEDTLSDELPDFGE